MLTNILDFVTEHPSKTKSSSYYKNRFQMYPQIYYTLFLKRESSNQFSNELWLSQLYLYVLCFKIQQEH